MLTNNMPNGYSETIQRGMYRVRQFSGRMTEDDRGDAERIAILKK